MKALYISPGFPDQDFLVGVALETRGFPGFVARWIEDPIAWPARNHVEYFLRGYFNVYDEALSEEHPFERLNNSSQVYTAWARLAEVTTT